MPVYKYRSFEEASEHLKKLTPVDPFERLTKLEKIIKGLKPPKKIQRGIFKFKTLEQANKHRQDQE